MASFFVSGVHDIIYQSQSSTIFLRHDFSGSYSEVECFQKKKRKRKKVGLQVFTTTPLSADTFFLFAQSINIYCFENCPLTYSVHHCGTPPGYTARRMYVHITSMLQSQPRDNSGADVICWKDLFQILTMD